MPEKSSSSLISLPQKSFAVEPVHLRLADLCREAIVGGDLAPGERFPSERDLAERYEVSRATANKVISSLVAEGLLEVQKGLGAFVRKGRTLFASLSGMESFTAHARGQGLTPSTEILSFESISSSGLPEQVHLGLGLGKKHERIVSVDRLRCADGIPMILERRWVRESLAKGLSQPDLEESFYRVLEEKFDLPMTGESHTISAVLLSREEARLFQESHPFPALRVEGTGFVRGSEPLWYQQLLYRGDRYQLHNETRGPAASAVELRLHSDPAA
ncbi:MAG: GntR family transcriptional regulator [Verrucomicrobiota bacterium]